MFVDPEFWRQLNAKLTDRREDEINAMISGNRSGDKYHEAIGVLRALKFVNDAAQDVMEKMSGQSKKGDA